MKTGAFAVRLILLTVLAGGAARESAAQSGIEGHGPTSAGEARAEPSSPSQGSEPLLEGSVDPASYILGPGDVLGLTLQGSLQRFQELTIVPEGTVMIAGAGPVAVAGLSLAEAREVIRSQVARAYRNVEVLVTLLRLRKFVVFVLGQVQKPGQYPASQADRVSEAIVLAGGALPHASERWIVLTRRDGRRERCDLLRFWRTGDRASNPQLRDGDVVLVDFRHEGVLVSGEVYRPGEIEFLEGDSLGGMIDLAGGLTQRAKTDTIEVARFAPGATVPEILHLHGWTPEQHADLLRFRLQPKDAIHIRSDPGWDVRYRVEVRGEVLYPGTYVIDEEKTTLSEIIERAGGFTPDAGLVEASLVRSADEPQKDPEYERLKLVPPANMTRSEYEYFKMRGRQNAGRMAVDFVALFERGDRSQDVLLKDGDLITVPLKKEYVTLAGQVATPGNVPYERGLSADEYIQRAGGHAWKAAKGKTVVIRASTGEWVEKDDVERIDPGDTIWVPEKPERGWFQVVKEGLLVASQVATIYLVIRTSTE